MIIDYGEFIDEKIRTGIMHNISTPQREKLIKTYYDFPIYSTVKLKSGEIINFTPEPGQQTMEYIHHFLIKFNNGRHWFSENYLNYINTLINNLNNYDERILGLRELSPRISFTKEICSTSKWSTHVIICKVLSCKQVVAWTHFGAKKAYINNLLEVEKRLISERGIVDNKGFEIDLNCYEALKRKTPLYLGSGALSGFQKP
jgi:hypothetical protein